jgi:hypothetical protein
VSPAGATGDGPINEGDSGARDVHANGEQESLGAAAGAASTRLKEVTYIDTPARDRSGCSTPEDTVEKLPEKANIDIPGSVMAATLFGLEPAS